MYLGVYIDLCFSLLSFPTPYIHNIFAWLPCIHLHILIIAYFLIYPYWIWVLKQYWFHKTNWGHFHIFQRPGLV